ncbi:hypothetical protein HNR19_003108 [Nocardioides thalensis]|uniref:HNH nuclease domain-containing protein n=1 Tax=Nocardioides thalensis TaxID=1914755 RepID=A0A853C2J5_9ACTN|nr:HNH endonuclease signature motif containing protein [Nocardioides thalensis]NYJ02410.1 hypothetical protein [Nocardioides thalensis]
MTTSTTGTAPAVPVVGDPVPDHPVLAALAAVDAALASVRETQPVFMTTRQKKQALLAAHRIRAQFAELQARLLASSSDVAEADGASDVASWLSHHTQCDLRGSKRDLKLAQGLDARYPKVAKAMADGVLSVEHARVIVAVLDALPAVVSLEIRDKAEAELINRSTEFTPDEIRRLGRRILEVVAPEIFEDAEAKKLLEEEQSARKRMRLFFKNTGDGTTRLTGLLPTSEAERLKTYLHAYTSPRHANGEYGEADTIPYSRKLAGAFCALLEHLDPHRLPLHGGDATTLMVTITLEDLKTDLAVAGLLGDKDPISASEARRLACTAGIIPVVLGNHSEVLDLGRTDRLYRPAQRKAIRLRDQQCRTEGCRHPAEWCEVHHLKPWSQGGRTDLDDGVLMCPHDHHRIHDPTYDWQILANGQIRFTKKQS